jgi:hypothetical protein
VVVALYIAFGHAQYDSETVYGDVYHSLRMYVGFSVMMEVVNGVCLCRCPFYFYGFSHLAVPSSLAWEPSLARSSC